MFGSEQGYQDPLISQPQSSAISTPRIDAILEKFHKALGDQNLSSAATSADATLTVDDVVPGGGAASTNPSPGGSSGYDVGKDFFTQSLSCFSPKPYKESIDYFVPPTSGGHNFCLTVPTQQ